MVLQKMGKEVLFLGLGNIFNHICGHKYVLMGLRIHLVFLLSFSFLINSLHSQDSLNTIVAKNGDGIFSMLRKNGMEPVKYYEDFLNLNEKNIRKGSELIVGKIYFLPDAPDSFKNMGTQINVDTSKENPIFNSELSLMKLKDSTLKNTVYFLMYSKNLQDLKETGSTPSFITQLAYDLLIRGARVYVLDKEAKKNDLYTEEDSENFHKEELGSYVGIINKKYLRNNGSYQRLLVVQQKSTSAKDFTISVHHNNKSREGKRLASNLQDIFAKNWVSRPVTEKSISPFNDETTIYLAKNVLPSVTTIDFNLNPSEKGIKIKSVKTDLAKIITGGILQDYSNTNFSD